MKVYYNSRYDFDDWYDDEEDLEDEENWLDDEDLSFELVPYSW